MCGIAGIYSRTEEPDEGQLRRMVAMLTHRGPDANGIWCDAQSKISMAHARLSVIDVSPLGHQPMVSPERRYIIVFNGEIYNHKELRAELESLSSAPNWKGHSDTETLLACFEVWGIERTLCKSVGMFAFAVWSRDSGVLTLARDRMGEKPLYYGWQGETFLFGSELKALKAHPAFAAEIDRDSLAGFLRCGYISSPQSIYRGIHKLPPGTLLSLGSDVSLDSAPRAYWSLPDVAYEGALLSDVQTDDEAVWRLHDLLSEAVSMQKAADVPLGAFLSGGIDSSLIVSLLQEGSAQPVNTYTIGFEDSQYNEAGYAKLVAKHLGTNHTELYVTASEARAVIPLLPSIYDEPFADSSQIPTFLLCRMARKGVTVSLSGDGGDELFGGYNRYTWTKDAHAIPRILRVLSARCIRQFPPRVWDRLNLALRFLIPEPRRLRMLGDKAYKLAALLEMETCEEIYSCVTSSWMNSDRIVIGGRELFSSKSAWNKVSGVKFNEQKMMLLDSLTYLPDDVLCKVDRAAMAVSLETRVPFLDHRVVEYAWRLPLCMKIRNGKGKWILREILRRYVPMKLVERPKMGFGVPIDSWLRGPLRDWAESLLNEKRLAREGYFHPKLIRIKWAQHLSGLHNWQYPLWNVLMFQSWLENQSNGR